MSHASIGRRLGATLLLALSLWLAGSCGESRHTDGNPPILLVGIDGFEWNVLLPLLRAGETPTLAGLMQRGSYGLLETIRPTFSPVIWTSIATGKGPAEHGIRGFVRRQGQGESRRLFNNYDRKAKAFWNILSDYGKRVAVVGWWMTYPAEPVNGLMVAQVNTLDQANRKQGRAIIKGQLMEDLEDQVYPPERLEEVLSINRRVSDTLPDLNRKIFGSFSHPMRPLTERLWDNTQWAFRADATYLEITTEIADEGWDLLAVYLGGADVAAHRFWRHLRPEAFDYPPPPEEIEDFGDVVPDYYRYIDQSIDRILDRMPSETTVLIVSDHGMHAANRQKAFSSDTIPDKVISAGHSKQPPGVVIAAGAGIASRTGAHRLEDLDRSRLSDSASIFDVTPTLLTLLGIPVGADMKGRVLDEWLAGEVGRAGTVPSHDTQEWVAARAELEARTRRSEPERLEQLRALGYID